MYFNVYIHEQTMKPVF